MQSMLRNLKEIDCLTLMGDILAGTLISTVESKLKTP